MFRNLKLRHKLLLIQGLAGVALVAVTMAALWLSWDARLEERKEKLRDMVAAANSVLADLDTSVKEGGMSRVGAVKEARTRIETMTVGEEDFLFMTSFDGTPLAGRNKDWLGHNVFDVRDSEGRAYVQAQIAAARAGGGFVRYSVPRPNTKTPLPKLSYVAAAPGWDAYLGMGVFIDDLKREFWSTTGIFLGVISIVLLFTVTMSEGIAMSIVRPIKKLQATIGELSQGNLDAPIHGTERRDEVGDLARGVQSWKTRAIHRGKLRQQVEAAHQDLLHQALHDDLTGLPNGRQLMETLMERLRRREATTVVVISLSGLGRIAERHGGMVCQEVIRTLAARLRHRCDKRDFVASLTGEKFAVLISNAEPDGPLPGILADLSAAVQWSSLDIHVTASAGMASSTDVDGSAEALLQAAIAADNHSEQGGIGCYTPALRSRIERESLVERRLRVAIDNADITVALQPKVRSADGVLVGAEALARWRDDELGEVPPSEFVPVAERLGIIGDLDGLMLRRSLVEATRWRKAGLDLTVAANVSAIELRRRDLVARIAAAMEEADCEASRVVIELTESAVADDPAQAIRQLSALKELGVSLSLDDFGTGYSSLSYLRRFPIDTLKIDRSFVIDTPHDHDAVAIARTIVALARSLGMDTVAEGIETESQAAFLRGIGAHVLQGYLYGRPMPPDQFFAFATGEGATRLARLA